MPFEQLPRATVEGSEHSPPTSRPGTYAPKQTYSHSEMVKHPLTMEDLLEKQRLAREIKERRVVKPAPMDEEPIEEAPKSYRVPPSTFFNQSSEEAPDESEIPTQHLPSTEPVPNTDPVPETDPIPSTIPATMPGSDMIPLPPSETPTDPPVSGVREKSQDEIVISGRGTIDIKKPPSRVSII